jgi:mannose-6-phosphate isomerase-like protein (cupin superfamily)
MLSKGDGKMETIVRATDEGQATWFFNGLMTTKADLAETGGAYALSEHLITAASNPPVHVHNDEEESFYVLEGEMEIEVGGRIALAGPGTFALLPRGVPHTWRVLTDTVRTLVINSGPGAAAHGGSYEFFQEVGSPALQRALPTPQAPDPVAVTAIAALHNIDILPPPGA